MGNAKPSAKMVWLVAFGEIFQPTDFALIRIKDAARNISVKIMLWINN
jgi:hypothetical protein